MLGEFCFTMQENETKVRQRLIRWEYLQFIEAQPSVRIFYNRVSPVSDAASYGLQDCAISLFIPTP